MSRVMKLKWRGDVVGTVIAIVAILLALGVVFFADDTRPGPLTLFQHADY